MQGVFLDTSTITTGDLDLTPLHEVLEDWIFHDLVSPADVSRAIQDAEIVVSNKVILDSSAISGASRLRLICIAATGANNVDLAAASTRNIAVCNVSAYATASVVEHVFLLMLALSRRLPEHMHAIRQGHWQRATHFSMLDYPFGELSGRILGIIGFGELGSAVARMARTFGMQVLIAERAGRKVRRGRCSLGHLFENADVISLHCPLTPETENLLNAKAFDKMKSGAILINTARGGIINEADLLQALKAGRIAAAAVDVLETEPPVNGSPLLDEQLPNLLVTPHIAWASRQARQRLVAGLAANIHAFLQGEPHNLVV